jgi:hypothetical protein
LVVVVVAGPNTSYAAVLLKACDVVTFIEHLLEGRQPRRARSDNTYFHALVLGEQQRLGRYPNR